MHAKLAYFAGNPDADNVYSAKSVYLSPWSKHGEGYTLLTPLTE